MLSLNYNPNLSLLSKCSLKIFFGCFLIFHEPYQTHWKYLIANCISLIYLRIKVALIVELKWKVQRFRIPCWRNQGISWRLETKHFQSQIWCCLPSVLNKFGHLCMQRSQIHVSSLYVTTLGTFRPTEKRNNHIRACSFRSSHQHKDLKNQIDILLFHSFYHQPYHQGRWIHWHKFYAPSLASRADFLGIKSHFFHTSSPPHVH